MNSARRWLLGGAVLAGVQALAIGGYLLMEHERARRIPTPAPRTAERMDQPLRPLTLERPGASLQVPSDEANGDDELTLLHVWATWCAPCREELPGLLALDGELPARLLTVSTDETWDVIEHFFEGKVPRSVWRVTAGEAYLPVSVLPSTFLVRGRSVVGRIDGAYDWTRESALALLASVGEGSLAH